MFRRLSLDDGRSFTRRFLEPPALSLAAGSADEILSLANCHSALIARRGCGLVMEFYERELWPALSALQNSPQVTSARVVVALNALESTSRYGPHEKTVEWAERINEVISRGMFEPGGTHNKFQKKPLREQVAMHLRHAAARLSTKEQRENALRCYALLERLSPLQPAEKHHYARLLWQQQDCSPAALHKYLQYMENPSGASLVEALQSFVSRQIVIDESAPDEEIEDRMLFNHLLALQKEKAPQALLNLGRGYLRLNKPESALRFLRLAQCDDHGGVSSFYLGQALFDLSRFQEATEAYDRAISHGYSRSRVLANQALSYAKSGRHEEALALFRDAELQLGPENLDSEFFVCWGRESFVSDSTEEAENQFERALALDPLNWRAINGIALCKRRAGKNQEAILLLSSALDATKQTSVPGPAAYLLGRLLQECGRLQEAVMYYRLAVHANPADDQYRLALGLALDDCGDPAALIALEEVARTRLAGAEVFRRLALGYHRSGNRHQFRIWLDRLWETAGGYDTVIAYQARDLFSQGTEALNLGRFSEAARFLDRALCKVTNPETQKRLAMALTGDVAVRLRAGESGVAVCEEVKRAVSLADLAESRFLLAFLELQGGRYASAREQFAQLAEQESRFEFKFFEAISAHVAGDNNAIAQLALPAGQDDSLESLLAFLRAQAATLRGEHSTAAEKLLAWAADPESVALLELPRPQLNELVAHCLRLGSERPSQIPKSIARLSEKYGNDFWDIASVLVKHHDIVQRGTAKASADRISDCESSYINLLQRITKAELARVTPHYLAWLEFSSLVRLKRHEIREAVRIFSAADQLGHEQPEAFQKLRSCVEKRLNHPSQEAAFSQLLINPERARQMWEEMLRASPGDLEAIHHLACWHWGHAWDEAMAAHFERSMPYWRKGFEYYCQIYTSSAFWDSLKEKGSKLVQPGLPFDEEKFEAWRQNAVRQCVSVLLDFIGHVINQAGKRGLQAAVSAMNIIYESSVGDPVKRWASEELAARRLDRAPANLTDYNASKARAEQVVDIDSKSAAARRFLLRATAHQADERYAAGERDFRRLNELLRVVQPHAQWLNNHIPEDGDAEPLKQDLCFFYDEVSKIKDAEGCGELPRISVLLDERPADYQSQRFRLQTLESALLHVRQAWEECDDACRKSLALQPVNFNADKLLQEHQEQYRGIANLLQQIHRSS